MTDLVLGSPVFEENKNSKLPIFDFDKCQYDLAEKEVDLGAVQVLDETHRKFHNRCKFCERRFDSSGEMGRHIGCKHTRDGEAFLSMADLDSEVLDTEMDQHKLNLKIEKTNKIELNHGASTAQIQTIKMAANQTMTTWIPDKMAANQTRTTWLPDVNNEDRFSENPLENKRTLFINNFISVHKIYKNWKHYKIPQLRTYTSLRKV